MKPISIDHPALDRVIEMAWEDRTPFEAIKRQFGLDESDVVRLMRKHLKRSSFALWRKRMAGRSTKHRAVKAAAGRQTHDVDERSAPADDA